MGNGENGDEENELVVRIDGDGSEPIFQATVVVRSNGGGEVSTRSHLISGERDRVAEAALMRQAAEILLESAERLRHRRDPRPRPGE